MQDVAATIISQYAASPILRAIIDDMNEAISPEADLDAFYDLVWNVDTAVGWGLDVWGAIVGVARVIAVPTSDEYIGWESALPTSFPFNQGVWYSGTGATNNFALADAPFRQLIFAKALSNISDGSIPAINRILLLLFPQRGNCYCTDGLDMSMTYTFEFPLSLVEQAIVGQAGVLSKPSGIVSTVIAP